MVIQRYRGDRRITTAQTSLNRDERSMRDLVRSSLPISTSTLRRPSANPWLASITLDRAYHGSAVCRICRDGSLLAAGHGGRRLRSGARSYTFRPRQDAVLSVLRLVPRDKESRCEDPSSSLTRAYGCSAMNNLRASRRPEQRTSPRLDPHAASIIVRRKRLGTMPLDDLPRGSVERISIGSVGQARYRGAVLVRRQAQLR